MCGLSGIASPAGAATDTGAARAIISNLALYNERRGHDGVGFSLITPGCEPVTLKRAVSASELLTKRPTLFGQFAKTMAVVAREAARPWTVIGHTRAATTGDVTDRNAHPFEVTVRAHAKQRKWVLGAHNGMLTRFEECKEKLGLKDKLCQVDSEVIFHGLSRYNEQNFLRRIEPFTSAALTYFKDDATLLRLYRQKTSSLWFRMLPEVGIIAWSSERNHLELATAGFNALEIFTPESDWLLWFDLNEIDVFDPAWDIREEDPKGFYGTHTPGDYKNVFVKAAPQAVTVYHDHYNIRQNRWNAHVSDVNRPRRVPTTEKELAKVTEWADPEGMKHVRLTNPSEITTVDGQGWQHDSTVRYDGTTGYSARIAMDKWIVNRTGKTEYKWEWFCRRYAGGAVFNSRTGLYAYYDWVESGQLHKAAKREEERRKKTGGASYYGKIWRTTEKAPAVYPHDFDKGGTDLGYEYVPSWQRVSCTHCEEEDLVWKHIYYMSWPLCTDCYDVMHEMGQDTELTLEGGLVE